jgi:hypothetical protein
VNAIVKYRPAPDIDAHIFAMYLLYCFAPSKPTPDIDGYYDLGSIGSDAEKNWQRWCPYAPSSKILSPAQED